MYDVICLQETFLKPGKNFWLNGYSTVRKDRIGMGKGGLITLVKHSLIYTETDSHNDIECILVKIKTDKNYITIANLYISPDQNVDTNQLATAYNFHVQNSNSG